MRFALLALRNLARNRRRTALSLAVVAAGTIALVLTAGFVVFSFDGLREAMIHGGLGHLEVTSEAAVAARGRSSLDRPLAAGLERWREVQTAVEREPGVVAATATLQVVGMVSKEGGESASFVGFGSEPERERRMGFATKLRAGRDLADDAPAPDGDEVLLAEGLARSLGARPDDVVTLLAADANGLLNALDVRVAGVVTTGVQDLDTRYLKLHLASAARLLATDRVSNLLVGLDRTESTGGVIARLPAALAAAIPGGQALAVVGWQERAPFYTQVKNLYAGIFWFLGAIVFVLVVLATSNTLVMSIFERLRELGTLRAVGTSRTQIAALVFFEALWLGLLGAAAGAALGAVAIAAINRAGLQMPPPPGAVSPIDLQLAFVPQAFAGAFALMALVLAVAALAPIAKATRLKIVDALGHV